MSSQTSYDGHPDLPALYDEIPLYNSRSDQVNPYPRSVVFVERGAVQPWTFGLGQDGKRVIPTGVFRTSDIEQMRMGVLEHLGIAQAPAWLFAAELREGTIIRLLTPLERIVPILAVRPASRRLSAKVRVFIEHHLEQICAVLADTGAA
jgi:DNA-binding transcriptional LysR family regulator